MSNVRIWGTLMRKPAGLPETFQAELYGRVAMAKYRVLSLDGGGSWALIQAKALMEMYGAETSGWDVLRQFDLVSANSGGSIVLGCLVENMPLSKILDMFMDEAQRRAIFSPTDGVFNKILEGLLGFGPKYSAEAKLGALRAVLPGQGDKTLTDAIKGCLGQRGTGDPVRLLIVGFDYDRCSATFFRSAAAGGPAYGTGAVSGVTLAEAIDASTNAPVNYFDGPAVLANGYRYWDGAITGCNNPVLAGVTEAVTTTKEFTEVVALSIGTGTVKLPWPQAGQEGQPYMAAPSDEGLVSDLKKLAGSILDDPPDMASFIAHVLTGSGAHVAPPADSQIVRMSPMISPVWDAGTNAWKAPGNMTEEDFTTMVQMPMDALDPGQVTAISNYADLWLTDVAPNQPIRMDGDTLKRELGQTTYSAAKAAWMAIR